MWVINAAAARWRSEGIRGLLPDENRPHRQWRAWALCGGAGPLALGRLRLLESPTAEPIAPAIGRHAKQFCSHQ